MEDDSSTQKGLSEDIITDSLQYEKVNRCLNEIFFDGRFEERPLYLDLEDNIAEELCKKLGCNLSEMEFVVGSAVADTIFWDARNNIYEWHDERRNEWIESGFKGLPPFTALLCSLTLAAEKMKEDESYSSRNYYQRLCEVYGTVDSKRHEKVSLAGKYTLRFWKTLNYWLRDTRYEYGRDTARKLTNWTYVSYALSQALVRDADRERFKKMFADFGFSSSENISESEMKLYIHEWMGRSSGPSDWLRKLWSTTDLQDRVVSAAVQSLEDWEGSGTAASNQSIQKSLRWMSSFGGFPKKKLNLFLTSGSNNTDSIGGLTLEDDSSNTAKKAFLKCDNGVWLSSFSGLDFDYLEPQSEIAIDDLMLSSFKLKDSLGRRGYERTSRPIVPLRKLEATKYFREVSRVTLSEDHMILCHDKWSALVISHLNQYARPGYKNYSAEQVVGVPPSWVLFSGVEFTSSPNGEISDHTQLLVPLAEGAGIHFDGGLKLGPNLWHESHPPECYAYDSKGLIPCSLTLNSFRDSNKVSAKQKDGGIDANFIALSCLDLDGGNYTIEAKRGRSTYSRDISFRSSLVPRSSKRKILSYFGDNKNGLTWSAGSEKEFSQSEIIVEGMNVKGSILLDTYKSVASGALADYGSSNVGDIANFGYLTNASDEVVESCVLRGYHYWIVNSYRKGPPSKSAVRMTCKDCGMSILSRKKKYKQKKDTSKEKLESQAPSISGLIKSKVQPVSEAAVLDALSYLGNGRRTGLESIVTAVSEDSYEVVSRIKNLVDLGHIDAAYKDLSSRPNEWSCAAPVLVLTESGSLFMSGFRTGEMISEISLMIEGFSLEVLIKEQPEGPPIVAWKDVQININDIKELLSDVSDPFGREIICVESSGYKIAASMPFLKEVASKMEPILIQDTRDLEKFNPQTGKWVVTSAFEGAGAYRTSFAGRKYFYVDSDRDMKQGAYELVKLLSAVNSAVLLHRYCPDSKEFQSVMGCEPPGLFRRALVACSGYLPEKRDGLTVYRDIPKEVANTILHKLYN